METRKADAPPAARMDRVTKDFNGVRALADVTFAVRRGALVGVIGPSGAGKTTAISLFTGNLVPTKGTVQTLGEEPLRLRRRTRERIAKSSARRRRCGQEPGPAGG